MFENIIQVFSSSGLLTAQAFGLATLASCLAGLALFLRLQWKQESSRSFRFAMLLLPFIVQVVIMLVNGNLGTGVAVMGAFGLVRFRSLPGSAKETTYVFAAMAIGLATGTGYLGVAAFLLAMVLLVSLIYQRLERQEAETVRILRLNCLEQFQDEASVKPLLQRFCKKSELLEIKCSKKSEAFRVTWRLTLSDEEQQSKLVSAIHALNNGIEVSLSRDGGGAAI